MIVSDECMGKISSILLQNCLLYDHETSGIVGPDFVSLQCCSSILVSLLGSVMHQVRSGVYK